MLLRVLETKLSDVLAKCPEEAKKYVTTYLDCPVFSNSTAAALRGDFHMLTAVIFSMLGLAVPKLTPRQLDGKMQFVAEQGDKRCMPTWSNFEVDASFINYARRALILVKTLRLRRNLTMTGTVKPKQRRRTADARLEAAGATVKTEAGTDTGATCALPSSGGKAADPAPTKVGATSVTPTSAAPARRRVSTAKATLEDLLDEMRVDAEQAYRAAFVALDEKAMKELQSVQKAYKDGARAAKLNVLEAGNVDLSKKVGDAIKGGLDLRVSPKVTCSESTVVA